MNNLTIKEYFLLYQNLSQDFKIKIEVEKLNTP